MLSGVVERLPDGTFKAIIEVQKGQPVGSLAEVDAAVFQTEKEANAWIASKGAWKSED